MSGGKHLAIIVIISENRAMFNLFFFRTCIAKGS